MAVGSSIVNLTASGLPTETEDRAYSFCLGTQILQNPSQTPRTGTFSFKVNPNQFDVSVTGDAVGTTAIGLPKALTFLQFQLGRPLLSCKTMGLGMASMRSALLKKTETAARLMLLRQVNQLQRLSRTALPAVLAALTILLSVRLTDTRRAMLW